MSRIELKKMSIDRSVLPSSIYAGAPYLVTEWGVRLSDEVRKELKRFLIAYLWEANLPSNNTYFRIDAYVDLEKDALSILEVNAHFVDGWGVALNLARSVGYPLTIPAGSFPKYWTVTEGVYRPELELACTELQLAGAGEMESLFWHECLSSRKRPAYWYGRFDRYAEHPQIFPAHGRTLDDKLVLARLSCEWSSEAIHLPRGYHIVWMPWETLPENGVLKWRQKSNRPEAVLFRDEIKGGKGSRRAYKAGEMIAQEFVPPHLTTGRPIQLIILANGTEPLTGYLQHALRPEVRILNDRSEHGPLLFL